MASIPVGVTLTQAKALIMTELRVRVQKARGIERLEYGGVVMGENDFLLVHHFDVVTVIFQ
jgi:hypothetical protein